MKKILLIASLFLMVALLLAACTEDAPSQDTSADTGAASGTEAPTDEVPTESNTYEDVLTSPEDWTAAAEPEKTEPEKTEPEKTEPEKTDPPETDPPETDPPETDPPETDPPETEPVDPNGPTNIFYAQDLTTYTGASTLGTPVLNDGYLTITPEDGDPYYNPFSNVKGDRFVAIKYRTDNAEGMAIQIYMGSTTLQSDNDMLKQPILDDGEWHLAIFDASIIDGQTSDLTGASTAPGSYDGSTVAFFRFDPMECEYQLDENGLPYKENNTWVRYPKPEGAYIDIAYIAFFDTAEKAERWEKLQTCKPAYTVSADKLYANATTVGTANDLAYNSLVSATLKGDYVTLTGTDEDAYVTAIDMGTTDGPTAKLLAIKYRTSVTDQQGQIFIGSSAGWTGQGDNPTFDYIGDGQWHLLMFDLSTVEALTDAATYLRYDFFKVGTGRSIDVQYIAFFETAEQAAAYDELIGAPTEPLLSSDKTTYRVGEPIMVTAYGSGTDWVGLAHEGATATCRWFYLDPVDGYISVGSGVPFDLCGEANYNANIDSAVTPGNYIIYLMPNDQIVEGNTPLATLSITVTE